MDLITSRWAYLRYEGNSRDDIPAHAHLLPKRNSVPGVSAQAIELITINLTSSIMLDILCAKQSMKVIRIRTPPILLAYPRYYWNSFDTIGTPSTDVCKATIS